MKTRYLAAIFIGLLMVSSFAIIVVDGSDASDDISQAYDTLNENQKKAYDALKKGVSSYQKNIPVSGITLDEGRTVRDAFESDNPEYFWFKSEYIMYYSQHDYMVTEFKADSLDAATIKSEQEELDAVISEFIPIGYSYADKVRSIHDWILLKVSYDKTTENSGNVYGALVEGKARCEGYAYTLNYVCKLNSIPSIYLSGTVAGYDEGHAWNILKMDNSKWYYMDVTWDDPKCPIGAEYDYFLIGSETDTPYGTFESSRTVDYDYGLIPSKTAYPYDPYPGGKTTDSISLSLEDVRNNIGKTGKWYYSVLNCKLFCDSYSMQRIADTMVMVSAEYWSFSISKSPSSQFPDTENPTDYDIRMFLDNKEVTTGYLGIEKHLKVEFPEPASSGFLKTVKIYSSDGQQVCKGNTLELENVGTYTIVLADFQVADHPILIGAIALLILLALILIIRNRIRARRAKNGYKNPANARVCRQCGARIGKGSDFCAKCGNKVPKK